MRKDYYDRSQESRPTILEKAYKKVEQDIAAQTAQDNQQKNIGDSDIALGQVEVKPIPNWAPKGTKTRSSSAGVGAQPDPTRNMLQGMEGIIGQIRYMADSLENMLNTVQIMGVMMEVSRKGNGVSMETLPMLAEMLKAKGSSNRPQPAPFKYQQQQAYSEQDFVAGKQEESKANNQGVDVGALVNKLVEENPEMNNNPMAKMLLQMLNQKNA